MMDGILNSTFFTNLIQIMLSAVSALVSLILYPFGLIIQQFLPALDDALFQISALFNYIAQYFNWGVNATGVPPIVISMIVGYYTFIVTVTLSAWTVKLLLKWKKAAIV